jgi:hypothetical protein
MARLCYDRNYLAIEQLRPDWPKALLLHCVGAADLAGPLRAACCYLLQSLYIDCDPHEPYEAVAMARLWTSLDRVDATDAYWTQRTGGRARRGARMGGERGRSRRAGMWHISAVAAVTHRAGAGLSAGPKGHPAHIPRNRRACPLCATGRPPAAGGGACVHRGQHAHAHGQQEEGGGYRCSS